MASENATLRKLGTATRDAASHIGFTSCETGSVIAMAERTVKEWDEYVYSINDECVSDGPDDDHKSTRSAEGPLAARNG